MVLSFDFSGVPISWEGTFSECFDSPKVSLRFQSTKLQRLPIMGKHAFDSQPNNRRPYAICQFWSATTTFRPVKIS